MKKNIISLILCAAAVMLGGCHNVSEIPYEGGTKYIAPETGEGFISPVYSGLSDEERLLYDKILTAANAFEESVDLGAPVPRETVRKIYQLVYSQERDCFWLSNVFYAPDREISVLKLSYLYTRDAVSVMRTELDIAASRILGDIAEDADDFDKVCRFHDEIVLGCGFTEDSLHSGSAYGVLVDGAGQCEGYAAAMSYLCDMADIPNYTVTGHNSSGESHAWNKVMLDGEWYNIDCTWDDPILNREQPDFIKHDYLLISDAEIEGITHFTDELYADMPECTGLKRNYFLGKGLVYDTAADALEAMGEQIKTVGIAGRSEVELRLSSESEYYAALARLIDNGEMRRIIEDVNGKYGAKIRTAYQYNNDRLYIVHLSLSYSSDSKADQ